MAVKKKKKKAIIAYLSLYVFWTRGKMRTYVHILTLSKLAAIGLKHWKDWAGNVTRCGIRK